MDAKTLIEDDLVKSSDLAEVALFIEQNAKKIGLELFPDDPFVSSIPDQFTVTIKNAKLNHFAENKDSCPMGKTRNPSRFKEQTLYYPAITGTLKLQFFRGRKDYPYLAMKKILNAMNIHVKSGMFCLPFTMWIEDFPSLGVMWVLSDGRVRDKDDTIVNSFK